MTETQSKRNYEIKPTVDKALKALEHLKKNSQPGDPVGGVGTKLDILKSELVRKEMQQLVDAGYTTKQIARALQDGDVFKILPKSITQVLNETPQGKKTRRAKSDPANGQQPRIEIDAASQKKIEKNTRSGPSIDNVQPKTSADFALKPDSDDI